MFKVVPHPKAYLTMKRNVQRGLLTRTRIILILEKETSSAREVAEKIGLRYASILHHLHLLEAEKILLRKGKRPYFWELTGAGQQRLTDADGRE
jgi:predicted ArsR family transcriptional regulator